LDGGLSFILVYLRARNYWLNINTNTRNSGIERTKEDREKLGFTVQEAKKPEFE
jgi:cell division protein FtsL